MAGSETISSEKHAHETSFSATTYLLRDITPFRLKLLLTAIIILAVLFSLVTKTCVEQHRKAAKIVGLDAAPSVIVAHQIKTGVEAMDAALADELLYPPGQNEGRHMLSDFEESRLNVSKALVAAAKNITNGKGEEVPIENLQVSFGQLLMESQYARALHNLGKDKEAVIAYTASLRTVTQRLLPNADALMQNNSAVLEDAYKSEKGSSAMARGLVMVVGILLCLLLFYTQYFLSVRFHRRLNLYLIIVTACTLLFLQKTSSALADSSTQLKVAKQDAYDSIVALLSARSDAYQANAAESRWLLDRDYAEKHQKEFVAEMAKVASFDKGHDFSETIAHARKELANHEKLSLPGFKGLLADELANIRFAEEGEAAIETLARFADYSAVDARIRALENSAKNGDAIQLALGYFPGASNYEFHRFDDALERAYKINQDHMTSSITEAFGNLEGLIWQSAAFTALAIVLSYFGIRARLEEYRWQRYIHKRG
jgi:hypothetical protein